MLNISIHPGALCVVADCPVDVAVEAVLEAHRQDPTSRFFREEKVDLNRSHTKTMTFDDYGDKSVIQCNWVDAMEAQRNFECLRDGGVASAIAFYYDLYDDYPAPNMEKQAEAYGIFLMTTDMKTEQDFNAMPEMTRGLNDYTKKWDSLTRHPELFGEKRNLLNAKKLTEILARFDIAPVFDGPIPEDRISYRFETVAPDPKDWEKMIERIESNMSAYKKKPVENPN